MTDAEREMHQAIRCLYVAVEADIAKDVEAKVRARVEELQGALQAVVNDIREYERINNLAPNPGHTECWDSVARAVAVLPAHEQSRDGGNNG